jgi:uncharacterized protein YbbC (DUF1343 family)/CubicO group peptidase (beta-lactamase class C family)
MIFSHFGRWRLHYVDARVAPQYIAHGFMPNNRARARSFSFLSVLALLFAYLAPVAPALLSAPPGSTPQTQKQGSPPQFDSRAGQPASASGQTPRPARAPTKTATLSILDGIVKKAIADDEIPGAVVLVGHHGRIVYRTAWGARALLPRRERMTADTVFDLASLTKVLATAPAVMKLVEEGKLRLNDPVAKYIPEFGANGKNQITVRMLLTHTSGLRPDPSLSAAQAAEASLLKSIYDDNTVAPPGSRFIYSDTGYIVLGELVRRLSGMPLDEFATRTIFRPLGMRHSRFRPPPAWLPRIAPTEEIDLPEGAQAGSGRGRMLRGVVHDPRSRAVGGVAGHAGLFSTADDVAIFCRMMLADGRVPGAGSARILAAATVRKMTTPQSPPWIPELRGLGWDIDSAYSSPRGELFPLGSYGHSGFTGTSIWIDPGSQTFVVLLANSVHPHMRSSLSSLRARVANAVAAAFNVTPGMEFTSTIERSAGAERAFDLRGVFRQSDQTRTGIDVLEDEQFASLRGKRVALITNQTGIDRQGRRTIDVLAQAEGVKLVAIFSPEHGPAGRADAAVESGTDAATGLPMYSLFGATLRPTDEMLTGVDALLFDIQDAGVRFYTYTVTMAYAMEEAARHHIPFYVLDRPNPLGGEIIEGPLLDPERVSFVGYFPMPVRYAMTMGELAQMFNAENKLGAELRVIAMRDWHRRDFYEGTGLVWIPPSPNLRSLNAALLYPGIEILQAAGVSVGRGTNTPFELFGAPWIHGVDLATQLNSRFIPGVRFVPTRFTPREGLYRDQLCEGIALVITDRQSLRAMLMSLEIAAGLAKSYPDYFALEKIMPLLGSAATIEWLQRGDAPARVVWEGEEDLATFDKMREKYLIYH